jgi:hypothetical protein
MLMFGCRRRLTVRTVIHDIGIHRRFKGVLRAASLTGLSPGSGTVSPLGAITAFAVLISSLKTSVDAALDLFVLLGLNGLLDAESQSSFKCALALASSHAFRWYRTMGIKANAAIATATMIQAIRKRGAFM